MALLCASVCAVFAGTSASDDRAFCTDRAALLHQLGIAVAGERQGITAAGCNRGRSAKHCQDAPKNNYNLVSLILLAIVTGDAGLRVRDDDVCASSYGGRASHGQLRDRATGPPLEPTPCHGLMRQVRWCYEFTGHLCDQRTSLLPVPRLRVRQTHSWFRPPTEVRPLQQVQTCAFSYVLHIHQFSKRWLRDLLPAPPPSTTAIFNAKAIIGRSVIRCRGVNRAGFHVTRVGWSNHTAT